MKTRLLKKLRKRVSNKYQVWWSNGKWRIYASSVLEVYDSKNKKDVIDKIRSLWHQEAEEYIWNNKKYSAYIWKISTGKEKRLIILLVILFCISSSCNNNYSENRGTDTEYYGVRKIWVDGHMYLKYTEGGLVHSESCPCKNK